MTPQELTTLIRNLSAATVELTKAVNSRRGYQGKCKSERVAIKRLLVAVLGRLPTDEEITACIYE